MPTKKSSFTVFQVKRLGKGCLSYIIVTHDKKSAVIVDPTFHLNIYRTELAKRKLLLLAVVDTHVHADHVSGGKYLAKEFSIPYLLPKNSDISFPFSPLETKLPTMVKGAHVAVIATPGHTKESVTIMLDDTYLFTGDTLFLDGVGRSDLGKDSETYAQNLYQSVTQQLFSLPNNLMVLPAHVSGIVAPDHVYTETLQKVKKDNSITKYNDARDFAKAQTTHLSPTPPNYHRVKEINGHGSVPLDEDVDELELGGNFCAAGV